MAMLTVLTACAFADVAKRSGPAHAGDDPGLRVLCTTATDRVADDRLALDLARAAGLGIVRMRAIGPRLFDVQFSCSPARRCAEGLARLQAAQGLLTDVTIDARRATPRPPRAEESP